MQCARFILATVSVVPDRSTSALILFTLIVIFAASWWTFGVLVGRSTEQRHRVAMGEWGRERGFRFRTISGENIPPPLNTVRNYRLAINICLASRKAMLGQIETSQSKAAPGPLQAPSPTNRWHFLIVETGVAWPPTGLRPVALPQSALDLFSLSSFPLLGGSERFVLYGAESQAAAALSRSSVRGILPADVGLLLHGRKLLLDFSARPFDTIEFERMIVVANQVVDHLPLPDSAK
ncbi:MAG TPA: hypothetical protein VG326_10700 [Tepidisphaeraceae bacterium]|jgi:hypothetical protein|nr:hypothetical protein [Tepidisphaeraceae bacterium]